MISVLAGEIPCSWARIPCSAEIFRPTEPLSPIVYAHWGNVGYRAMRTGTTMLRGNPPRGNPPRAWKWEIYRACRWDPLESSPVFFESMAVAAKEGKKALARLLAKANHAA